jgi:AcrR family transcriptional regulator
MRLFEERGYAATTVDDIAAAANVSRRTFFRYFAAKEEVFIVDPAGKLAALHVALAGAYFDPDLIRAEARVALLEPVVAAAGLAYQVRWEDALALEVAADLGVDIDRDARPRIVAHTTVAILRAGVAAWFEGGCEGDPAEIVASTFDRTTPALEAVLAMPPA